MSKIQYDENGLIPVIIQNAETKEFLVSILKKAAAELSKRLGSH